MKNSAILLIDSPDRKGLVAEISRFLYDYGANILHADQHQDQALSLFFMRIEWDLAEFQLDPVEFKGAFGPLARRLNLNWRIEYSQKKPRVAIFVSHYLHCLVDLLHRRDSGELVCEIPLIVSNHHEAEKVAAFHDIPFFHFEMSKAFRTEVEQRQFELLKQYEIDLIVLARYMQILSSDFVSHYPGRIINVHHSFLPAFSGAKPYHAAYQRGVKLIGATSHYVTEVLDDGPIIEQDVARVSHRDQLEDLVQKGRDVERMVLSRAVRWHLDRRILLYANKTVVFD